MRLRGFLLLLRADARAAELRLIWLALVLAAAALSSVGFVAQRLDSGLRANAAALLGGQVLVRADHPLPVAFERRALELGLQVTRSATFASMALGPGAQGRTHLVAVKAVDSAYPLFGKLTLRATSPGVALPRGGQPAPGTVWVDPQLTAQLATGAGGPVLLGERGFRVGALVLGEPDRADGVLGFAPRVLMNLRDLGSTGLVQPASRVSYALAVRGSDAAASAFAGWARGQIAQARLRGIQVRQPDAQGEGLERNLRRGADYLQLVAMLAALLAAIAVAVAAQDFAQRRLDAMALLKVLGLSRRRVLGLVATELAVLGASAALVGCALGWAGQALLVRLLGELLRGAELGPPGWRPVAYAGLTVTALLLAFGLPPALRLARVPPLRVLRREAARRPWSAWLAAAAGLGLFAAMLVLLAGQPRLGGIGVGGFGAAALALAAGAALLLWALQRLGRQSRTPLALAARQLAARRGQAVGQISALGLALMALLLVAMLRDGLLAGWQAALPPDAPNRFVINIQPAQAEAFRAALDGAGIRGYDWYPMVRGRLVARNGRAVSGGDFAPGRARELVEREFNLSSAQTLPAHNRVIAGRWDPAHGLSVDAGIASTLGWRLGDTLTFDIAGQRISALITSLRKVDWNSLRVNFFVLAPRALLAGQPATQITAFAEPASARTLDAELGRAFPDVTIIDLDALLGQVRAVLGQVAAAVQVLFAFALAAGLAVLVATLLVTRRQREHETAVWRVLGASDRLLRRVMVAELLMSGGVAGLLGTAAAGACAWTLARQVFDVPWTPSPWWLALGAAAGASSALLVGWASLSRVLRKPPLRVLRGA